MHSYEEQELTQVPEPLSHEKEAGTKEERRCIVTGAMLPKSALIRFVIGPGQQVVPDISGKLPGKGLWVSCSRDAVAQAAKQKIFSKVARKQALVPENLAEQVGELLKAVCLNMLSMAKKGGALVTGYTKVSALQEEKKAVCVIRACDSAFAAQEQQSPVNGKAAVISIFTNEELSQALGRENVVHAAITRGAMADKCRMLIERYKDYIR